MFFVVIVCFKLFMINEIDDDVMFSRGNCGETDPKKM